MNRRVLFVDDDEAMLERVEHSFRDRFDVCLAKSGEDGLDQLRTGAEPAVVVSDLYMPRMNGLEFIREARAVTQDTVFMMLTGNEDLATAADAVNEGEIFRYLKKPCPSRTLAAAIEAGIRQYDLITSQDELLHKTFCGSVKVLTEVLELSHPFLFQRSHAVERLLTELMKSLDVAEYWQFKLAARLVYLGAIVEAGETAPCADDEEYAGSVVSPERAATGRRLIKHIPRLSAVAEIVGAHALSKGDFPDPQIDAAALIEAGATLVRAAIAMDDRLVEGDDQNAAVDAVVATLPNLPENVIAALRTVDVSASKREEHGQEVKAAVDELQEGMVLARRVTQVDGSPLLSRGVRLNGAAIEKLRSASQQADLSPIYVFAPQRAEAPALAGATV